MLNVKEPKAKGARSPTLAPSRIMASTKPRQSISMSKPVEFEAKPVENPSRRGSMAVGLRKPSRLNLGAIVMLKGRLNNFQQQMFSKRSRSLQPQFENTYRTDPQPEEKFKVHEAQRYVENSLKFFLDDLQYHHKACARLAKAISEDIRRKVKENLQLKRYKLICHVMISENIGQSLNASSRSVWNDKLDNFVTAEYSTPHLLGTATLYALYYE